MPSPLDLIPLLSIARQPPVTGVSPIASTLGSPFAYLRSLAVPVEVSPGDIQ